MPKLKKILIILGIFLSACIGALICFFALSAVDKINTKKDLVIQVSSVEETYTGSPIYANSYTIEKGSLSKGDYIDINYNTSQTYVGEGKADADVTIYSEDNVNVTANYNLKVIAGTIKINKKKLVLEPSKEISIDENLANCNLFNIVEGDINLNERIIPYAISKIERTQDNLDIGCRILDTQGFDVTDNYELSFNSYVKLKKAPLVITTKSASKTYDGTPLYNTDFVYNTLYEGDTINFTNYTTITDYEDGGVVNELTSKDIEILDSAGNDVSSYYNVIFNNVGVLTILKKNVSITTTSLDKTYSGEDYLSEAKDFSISDDGVIDTVKLYAQYKLETIIDAGSYKNVMYIPENDITKNYSFNISYGTINVEKKDVEITTASLNKTYSGEDYITEAQDFTISDETIKDKVTSHITYSNTTLLDAGVYNNIVTIDTANDDLKNYNFNITYGTINIEKKDVDITTASLNKTYSGEDYISDAKNYTTSDSSITTKVDSHITYSLSKIVEAGIYINEVTIDTANDDLKNYNFDITYGTINVEKKDVHITTASLNKTYSGEDYISEAKSYTIDGDTNNTIKNKISSYITFTNSSFVNAGIYQNEIKINDTKGVLSSYSFDITYGIINIEKLLVTITLPTFNLTVGSTKDDITITTSNVMVSNKDVDDIYEVISMLQLDIVNDEFTTAGTYQYSAYLVETPQNLNVVINAGTINVSN